MSKCMTVWYYEVDFFDETLKNKLIYGATHDPNADNSEHAIDGPGKPLEPTE